MINAAGELNEVIQALLIIGTIPFVSMLTSWLKQSEWRPERKRVLTAIISIVFAVLITIADGRFDIEHLGATFVLVLYGARAFFNLYFEKTDLNERLEKAGDDDSHL